MSEHAAGSFEVKLTPQPKDRFDRMTIDKQFHGDLEATSEGEMMAVRSATAGSAGYVAMERVTGTLKGRSGSFVLQHSATMHRGVGEMNITVVPDSGEGSLAGLAGKLIITIVDGKHFYAFDYTLSAE